MNPFVTVFLRTANNRKNAEVPDFGMHKLSPIL